MQNVCQEHVNCILQINTSKNTLKMKMQKNSDIVA